ncbi:MAG: excinuclease ABC subunit UvrC, partial [Bacteroidota bacterium]
MIEETKNIVDNHDDDLSQNNSSFEEIKSKLHSVPTKPGVYIYKNSDGKIIYVGKAKNLRNRVRSYFQQGKPHDPKTQAMINKISSFDYIVTNSEAEALILEDTLVKQNKPRYNILLRDDKSYPYVRVTNEPYPRLFPTRKIIRDGSKYYGPFTEVRHLKRLIRTIRTLFHLRSCDYNITAETIEKHKYKVCLDYHIKKCDGPCEGLIPQEKYIENVKNAVQIINGKTKDLEHLLEHQMDKFSEEMKFEQAAIVRNRLLLLKEYLSQQKIVTTELIDRDVFGISRIENTACSLILKIRDGKLIGKRHFIVTNAKNLSDKELLETTIEKWYLETEFFPDEIFLPFSPENEDFISDWLCQKAGHNIELIIPKIGDKKKIQAMANINAEFQLREYLLALTKREQTLPRTLLSIQRDLHLPKPPRRIECIDNSHIQGSELVSSVVVFEDGKPK